MKKRIATLLSLCTLLVFAAHAQAITVTPSISVASGTLSDYQQSGSVIELLGPPYTIEISNELYRYEFDVDPPASGILSQNYEIIDDNPERSALTIHYTSGAHVSGDNITYMIVKDGNADPAWYLFNLTDYWDGIANIELEGFWPGDDSKGQIGHISLHGTAVPLPGTLLLLGTGLLALVGVRRKINS